MSDSIRELLDNMRDLEAQCAQLTPRDAKGRPIFTVLIVDQPDEEQVQALAALQASWDDDGPDASDIDQDPTDPARMPGEGA